MTEPLGWPQLRSPRRDGYGAILDRGSRFKGGRVEFQFMGETVSASRVVWFINTGVWPKGQMGIRNTNQADIRFANLYLVGEPDVSDLV